MGTREHKNIVINRIKISVISVSTTRSIENDYSGQWIIKKAQSEGHLILNYKIVKDNQYKIRAAIVKTITRHFPNIVLVTGGTGLDPKDVTIEALAPLFSREIPGFAYMFTKLSYEEIGSAAIMSRASAGIIDRTAVFCMPGSKNACKLACKKLIFPELSHIVAHITQVS